MRALGLLRATRRHKQLLAFETAWTNHRVFCKLLCFAWVCRRFVRTFNGLFQGSSFTEAKSFVHPSSSRELRVKPRSSCDFGSGSLKECGRRESSSRCLWTPRSWLGRVRHAQTLLQVSESSANYQRIETSLVLNCINLTPRP